MAVPGCQGLQECLLLDGTLHGERDDPTPTSRVKRKSVACAPLAVHTLCSEECREEFQQSLSQRLLEHLHSEGSLPEDNWEQLKQCTLETAEECVR